ncbi:MAG: radical SAM protein, partial [Deltaproteobacteria bacterium]|nr:radical SAM protein [Deltaproteobacteria bacterium]
MQARFRRLSIDSEIAFKLLKYKLDKRPFPLIAHLLVTNRCNLSCVYCYPQVTQRKIPDMAFEQWAAIIDKLYALGTRIFVLLGGEPLLRADIGKLIEYCKSKRTIVELITNGYFVDKKQVELRDVDSLCFSLDGNEEQNDKVRGKGSYRKVLEAIQAAKAAGIHCRIHAVMTRETVPSIGQLCELAKRVGVTINFTQATIHTEDPSVRLSDPEMRTFLQTIRSYKKEGYPIANTYEAIRYVEKFPLARYGIYPSNHVDSQAKRVVQKCLRPVLTTYIDADGLMYPCANIWNKGTNSIFDSSVETAWQK